MPRSFARSAAIYPNWPPESSWRGENSGSSASRSGPRILSLTSPGRVRPLPIRPHVERPRLPVSMPRPWIGAPKPLTQFAPGRRAAQGATSGPTPARDAFRGAKAKRSPPRGHHATRQKFRHQRSQPRSALLPVASRPTAVCPRSEKGVIRCHPPVNSHFEDCSYMKWITPPWKL